MMKTRLISLAACTVILVSLLTFGLALPRADAQTGTAAPTAASAIHMTALVFTTHDGVPSGLDKANYSKAFGVAILTTDSSGSNHVDVELAGLVPNGLYSAWWINTTPSVSRGLFKGPSDSFTADSHGNASTGIDAAADSAYQLLSIVYAADKQMHGPDNPGTMGSQVYTQLIGDYPGAGSDTTMSAQTPAMAATQASILSTMGIAKAEPLVAVTFNGIPPKADQTLWTKQIGVAAMTMGTSGTDSIVLHLGRLVPNGLYTAWWTNSTPQRATGILSKAPGDPINADADGWASLNMEVPSNNNYQRLGVFYQADGKMPGTTTPGVMGSVAYIALIGAFPGPAGALPTTTRPAARGTAAATTAAAAAP